MSPIVWTGSGPRVALYSHDTMGLGHVRRNLLIARALAAPPTNASVLVISGIREAGAFAIPRGIDFLTLPAYRKDSDGRYYVRSLAGPASMLAKLRAGAIKAALLNFEPDLFIVDNVPRGALDELVPALDYLAARPTRCVLGIRDVLDRPAVVQRQWQRRKNFEAVRNYYDAVWIYGDPIVYETLSEYRFPTELNAKATYTGYLNPLAGLGGEPRDDSSHLPPIRGRAILCVSGGGQDGGAVACRFAEAELPSDAHGFVVTGPFMPRSDRLRLAARAASHPRLTVLEFILDPLPLMMEADSVVSMAGYNTVNEILSLEKPALLVPRCKPRMEQLIRAKRLKALGLVEFVCEEDLSGERISQWLRDGDRPASARTSIDFNGLDRISAIVADLVGKSCSAHAVEPLGEQVGAFVAAG